MVEFSTTLIFNNTREPKKHNISDDTINQILGAFLDQVFMEQQQLERSHFEAEVAAKAQWIFDTDTIR